MAEQEAPYVATVVGQLCVEAPSREEAEEKAVQWAMRHIGEAFSLTPGEGASHTCEQGQYAVSVTGTLNRIGATPVAVAESVRDDLVRLRRQGTILGVTMGEFRVAPEVEDNRRAEEMNWLV